MSDKVAVIGLGQMGAGMARRLLAGGVDVIGYDISADARAALRGEGLVVAETLGEAVAGRGVVLTSLPDPAAVRDAWLGVGGLVESAEGAVLVELSTIDPDTMREVAAAAEAAGLDVVDCPVSGGPKEAAEGTLVLITGGEEAAVDRAAPVLDVIGATRLHAGAVGAAKVVKLVNNMMTMGNILVASEAFALGVKGGVAPETLFEVLSQSGGRSHHFLKRFPNVLAGDYRPGFKMELGEKDLALAVAFGRMTGMPTPAAEMAREMAARALEEGYRGQDIVALHDMYRRWGEGGE